MKRPVVASFGREVDVGDGLDPRDAVRVGRRARTCSRNRAPDIDTLVRVGDADDPGRVHHHPHLGEEEEPKEPKEPSNLGPTETASHRGRLR